MAFGQDIEHLQTVWRTIPTFVGRKLNKHSLSDKKGFAVLYNHQDTTSGENICFRVSSVRITPLQTGWQSNIKADFKPLQTGWQSNVKADFKPLQTGWQSPVKADFHPPLFLRESPTYLQTSMHMSPGYSQPPKIPAWLALGHLACDSSHAHLAETFLETSKL